MSRSTSFKIFFVLFVIATIFYSTLQIAGIITPKQLFAVVMFVVCIAMEGRVEVNRYLTIYFVFILFFGLSSLFTGYFYEFLGKLIGQYFVAYVAFWATKILVCKFDGSHVLLNTLIVMGVLDAIITIFQAYGIELGNSLLSIMRLSNALDYLDVHDVESRDFLELVMPGMFSSGVYNGYYLMTVGLLSLYPQFKKINYILLFSWAIMLFACFCTQQRGPLLVMVVLSIFVFYKVLRTRTSSLFRIIVILIFSIIIFFALRFSYGLIMNGESRMAELGIDATGRDFIYSFAWNYYLDHPIFGGYFYLSDNYGIAPHNLILNALIYGGLFGGLAVISLAVKQIKPIIGALINNNSSVNHTAFIVGIGYLAFTLNSFLHNKSLVTGDAMLWMLWAVFYSEVLLTKFKIQKIRK